MNIKNFCTLVVTSALGVAIYEGAKSTVKYFGKAWAAQRVASENNETDEDAPAAEAPKPEKKPETKAPEKKDGQGKKDDKKPADGKQDNNGKKGDKKPEAATK